MHRYKFEDFQELIARFHEKMGLDAEPLDSNILFLEIDDAGIVLEFLPSEGAVLLWSEIVELPSESVTPEIQEKALGINMLTLFTGGGALCYNDATRQFLFAQPLSTISLSVEVLETGLRSFLAGRKLVAARLTAQLKATDRTHRHSVSGNNAAQEVILNL